jgi:hypothetical protein
VNENVYIKRVYKNIDDGLKKSLHRNVKKDEILQARKMADEC